MSKNIIGIYHKDCTDGASAAAVLLKKFPHVKLFALSHNPSQKQSECIFNEVTKETDVYTVDCAILVKELVLKAKTVTVLDHHIGVKEELDSLARENSNLIYIFNNNQSGASLTWTHFFGKDSLPEAIKLVEDSDLWKLEFREKTKYVVTYLHTFSNSPEKMLPLLESDTSEMYQIGKIMVQFSDNLLENLLKKTDPVLITIGEHTVSALNIRILQSELGNLYSKQIHKTATLFQISGQSVDFSFRCSEEHVPSALDLAKILGGGGHRNSAAARIPLKNFLKMLVVE